jgi:hypothetical protein
MKRANSLWAVIPFLLLGTSCQQQPGPQQIGIFVASGRRVVELTTFGSEMLPLFGGTSFANPPHQSVPSLAGVRRLWVDLPGVDIANTQVYWAASYGKVFTLSQQQPLVCRVLSNRSNSYEFQCSDFARRHDGWLFVRIGMPLGEADRLYPVRLSP